MFSSESLLSVTLLFPVLSVAAPCTFALVPWTAAAAQLLPACAMRSACLHSGCSAELRWCSGCSARHSNVTLPSHILCLHHQNDHIVLSSRLISSTFISFFMQEAKPPESRWNCCVKMRMPLPVCACECGVCAPPISLLAAGLLQTKPLVGWKEAMFVV